MINLIPPKAKKAIVREYWVRVISIWLVLLGVVFFALTLLSLPSWVLVNALSTTINTRMNQIEGDQQTYSELAKEVKDFNEIIKQVDGTKARVNFSELIYTLDDIAGDNILLTQFSLKETEGKIDKINLIGYAATRVDLSNFREVLENHDLFSDVDLPISNLAKDKDITFSLSVAYVPQKE
jgi:hypothetical protein